MAIEKHETLKFIDIIIEENNPKRNYYLQFPNNQIKNMDVDILTSDKSFTKFSVYELKATKNGGVGALDVKRAISQLYVHYKEFKQDISIASFAPYANYNKIKITKGKATAKNLNVKDFDSLRDDINSVAKTNKKVKMIDDKLIWDSFISNLHINYDEKYKRDKTGFEIYSGEIITAISHKYGILEDEAEDVFNRLDTYYSSAGNELSNIDIFNLFVVSRHKVLKNKEIIKIGAKHSLNDADAMDVYIKMMSSDAMLGLGAITSEYNYYNEGIDDGRLTSDIIDFIDAIKGEQYAKN